MPPTVPKGTQRVRVCLHAGNTTQEIDRFVECVGGWLRLQHPAVQHVISSRNIYNQDTSYDMRAARMSKI